MLRFARHSKQSPNSRSLRRPTAKQDIPLQEHSSDVCAARRGPLPTCARAWRLIYSTHNLPATPFGGDLGKPELGGEMSTTNADSPPRIGVCFLRDGSLSAFAVGNRGQWPDESRRLLLQGLIAVGDRSVVGCQLQAGRCQLSAGLDRCRLSPRVQGTGWPFFVQGKD